MKVLWKDVEAYPALDVIERDSGRGVPVWQREHIGSTTARGADMVIVNTRPDTGAPRDIPTHEGVADFIEMAHMGGDTVITSTRHTRSTVYGQARVERVDDESQIFVRTPTGEYRAELALPATLPYSDFVALHAQLYQRVELVRKTALPVPVRAGALQHALAGGRDATGRATTLAKRLTATVKRTTRGEHVTVDIVLPKTRAMRLRIQVSTPIFPEFSAAPRRELPALVGEAMARALPTRGYQAVLAAMALVYQAGGVELDNDELPKTFRLAVMRVIGMPSSGASKAQRELVANAMAFVSHVEICVRPTGNARNKRPEYLPILVHTAYQDAPDAPHRRAARLAINPELLGDMEDGRLWRVPEALFQITDEGDRDSVLRLLGFQLCNRLAMGTSGHEALAKLLQRAGLWEWATRQEATQRGSYVLDTLRRSMDTLRALPHAGHACVDIVGGAHIVGDSLKDARVEYRAPPGWVHSSAPSGLADMTRHDATPHDDGTSRRTPKGIGANRPALGGIKQA